MSLAKREKGLSINHVVIFFGYLESPAPRSWSFVPYKNNAIRMNRGLKHAISSLNDHVIHGQSQIQCKPQYKHIQYSPLFQVLRNENVPPRVSLFAPVLAGEGIEPVRRTETIQTIAGAFRIVQRRGHPFAPASFQFGLP